MGLGVSGFTGRPLGGRPRGRLPVGASLEGPAALSSAAAWRFARPTSGEPWLAPHPFLCHGVVSLGLDTTSAFDPEELGVLLSVAAHRQVGPRGRLWWNSGECLG
ncbi:hypothetical protein MRX96_059874 [Rhipicephalus microplus]